MIEGNVLLGFDFSGTVIAASQQDLYKTGNAVFGMMPPFCDKRLGTTKALGCIVSANYTPKSFSDTLVTKDYFSGREV